MTQLNLSTFSFMNENAKQFYENKHIHIYARSCMGSPKGVKMSLVQLYMKCEASSLICSAEMLQLCILIVNKPRITNKVLQYRTNRVWNKLYTS